MTKGLLERYALVRKGLLERYTRKPSSKLKLVSPLLPHGATSREFPQWYSLAKEHSPPTFWVKV